MADKILPRYLVSERVLRDQWYFDQLTLLLRKSYGVKEQISFYMDIVRLLNNVELNFFNLLGHYDENTNLWLLNIDEIGGEGTESDLLDKIGTIFGVQRYYSNITIENKPLNNYLMYSLIYAKIIRNNYDGTFKTANEMYDNLYNITNKTIRLYLYSDSNDALTAHFYLSEKELDESTWDDTQKLYVKKLFNKGFFDIKSVGITYSKKMVYLPFQGFFDHMWKNDPDNKGTVLAVPEDWESNPPKYVEGTEDEPNIYCTWDHAKWGA